MGNLIGRRVPDRTAETFGGNNPFPVAAEVEAGQGQNTAQTGQQTQGWRGTWGGNNNNEEALEWKDLDGGQKAVAGILAVLACLIFIYPPMALGVGSTSCPEEFFLLPYFGFVLGAGTLTAFGGASTIGPKGVILALFPLIFFSLPAIFMFATGFGDGCVFLGVENGLFLFYPVLTGSFLLISCTAGRSLRGLVSNGQGGGGMMIFNRTQGAWANTQTQGAWGNTTTGTTFGNTTTGTTFGNNTGATFGNNTTGTTFGNDTTSTSWGNSDGGGSWD